MGIGNAGMVRSAIVLEDLDPPQLVCRCGGDPTAPNHDCSLLHMQWNWLQRQENWHG